jgi:CheY-like chemotaxis protein
MDALDYDKEAILNVRRRSAVETETGTLAAMVTRAIALNADPACSLSLAVDNATLGFGLIEAIYHRPDFPREVLQENGWVKEPAPKPPSKPLAALVLAKVAEATGLDLPHRKDKPVVLLVEDEPLVRMLGADLLTEAGFDVVEANDAEEALEALRAHPEIQVLFTDVNMPGSLDGLALASVARERRPDLKLLIGSGVVRPVQDDLPSNGRFLAKPYRPAAVVDTIRAMLAS